MLDKKPKICIIAHNAYGAITGGEKGHVGGAEHQTTLIARWFAANGYETSIVTWDEGQPSETIISDVKVRKMSRQDAGIPILRFFYPRLTSLYAALSKADADIYYHNSAEYVTGLIAIWCRYNKKKFIYSIASDVACDPRLPAMRKNYERILYNYGLRHADRVIVQTETQQKMLKDGFGLSSLQMSMPCPGPSENEYYNESLPPDPPTVLWVGRVANMKRLEWFLEVAESLPDVQFGIAAANMTPTSYSQELYSRAKCLTNVIWHGAVGRANMPMLYKNAYCLCCTSSYEGFPNTFLEAWSYGRPVITTFDPDGLIERLNLGTVKKDIPGIVQAVYSLIHKKDEWFEKSSNSRRYYLENHRIEVAMPCFEREFLKLSSDNR